MKRVLIIFLLVLSLVACGNDDNGKAFLNSHIADWGQPSATSQEDVGGVIFVTYTWNSAKGHAKLVLSKSHGKWEEVRFDSY